MQDFEQVYLEHYSDVYCFVLSLCRDSHLSEDIAQQTFFKAVKSIDSFNRKCSIKTWLCQIAKNTYFDHLRKHKRLAPMDDTMPEGYAENVEMRFLQHEDARALHTALHALPEPYKEVFSLRIFAELPMNEIASLFGKSDSWARVTFYRAKLMLQDAIKEEEP